MVKKFDDMLNHFVTAHKCDGQIDRQTDRQADSKVKAYTALVCTV